MSSKFAWLYFTAPNREEAKSISKILVQEYFVACANIFGPLDSIYIWEEKLCEEQEFAVICKTQESRVSDCIAKIKSLHSHECPGIVSLLIEDGNPDFLAWIKSQTNGLPRK